MEEEEGAEVEFFEDVVVEVVGCYEEEEFGGEGEEGGHCWVGWGCRDRGVGFRNECVEEFSFGDLVKC